MASFGGKAWGGYGFRRDSNKSHYAASLNNFKKEIPIIRLTNFSCQDYHDIVFEKGSFIYLDPPYKGTTGYNNKNFNHESFYQWAKQISKDNYVIISEYSMPDDFICFKSITHKQSLDANNNSKEVSDNLYYYEGLFKKWYKGGK